MSKYRNEIKISINPFDRQALSSRLSSVLKKDRYAGQKGYYKVRSLYFDYFDDSAVREKLMGVKYREKFRIRVYDNSVSVIRLEKKVKNGNLGYKETALLTLEECRMLMNGDFRFLLGRPEQVCKQLYTRMRTGLFKPKTIVEYEREAYVWEPGRIRVTIDSGLKTGMNSTDFLNFDVPMAYAADNNTSILEIKYNSYLPAHISNLVRLDSRHKESISKYVMCRCFG